MSERHESDSACQVEINQHCAICRSVALVVVVGDWRVGEGMGVDTCYSSLVSVYVCVREDAIATKESSGLSERVHA